MPSKTFFPFSVLAFLCFKLFSLNLQPLSFLSLLPFNLLPFNLLPLALNGCLLLSIVIFLKALLSLLNDLVTGKKTLMVKDLREKPIKHSPKTIQKPTLL